jgi:hypothetical protein
MLAQPFPEPAQQDTGNVVQLTRPAQRPRADHPGSSPDPTLPPLPTVDTHTPDDAA